MNASMPSDIQIGTHFTTGERLFRCTDVGSRVIVAIPITQVEIVTERDGEKTKSAIDLRDQPHWGKGPSYAVAELVFDEDDYPAMVRVPDNEVAGWTPEWQAAE